KAEGKPFFLWLNPTRMHIVTHLSPKYEALRNSKNGWTIHEAGMAQLDDDIGIVMQKLKDMGVDDNTIVVFTTDNGTEVFTWPDGGQTPFAQSKGTVFEGGFRVPCMIRWPGKVPAGKVENGIISGLDWFPTFLAAARKVGNQSSPEMIPFSTLPAGTLPGQRIMQGTRKPPSKTVPLLCANGVCPPSGQVKTSVPLSVVNTTMVLSSTPMSLSFCITMPMSSSSC